MVSVCLYLQIHQPLRLRRYSVFDSSTDYFDHHANTTILQKVAEKCYVPATQLLVELARRHEGRFRFAFSVTGSVIEQLREQHPAVIDLLREAAATGCVEFLSETYNHSLAYIYSRDEFRQQIEAHRRMIEELFGQTPRVFRNTELIYNNDLAAFIRAMGGYVGILAEGADHILGPRNPNYLYHPPGASRLALMLKNYRLSDDIAFRFSNQEWEDWPLTSKKFANCIKQIEGEGDVCNLFMDYETFGEHQWKETGIFEFLESMPDEVFNVGHGEIDFKTPSECIESCDICDEYDVPHMISWADTERDLTAWLGNAMQSHALHELYKLEDPVKASGDEQLLTDWRRLTCSDHFYYMCTKYYADGEVHKYFNPYESPYDSYINFMNVIDNMRTRAGVMV